MANFLTPFTNSPDYTLSDPNKVEVDSGLGKLKQGTLFENLLLYWKAEESLWDGTPNEVVDSSGQGNNGQSYNGAVTSSGGKIGRRGVYDGVLSYVACPHNASFNFGITGDFTLAMWVRTSVIKNHRYVGRYNSTATNGYYGFFDTGGTVKFFGYMPVDSGVDIRDGLWHLVIGIRDQNGTRMRIFIDNVLRNFAIVTAISVDTTAKFAVGRWGDYHSAGDYFEGDMDDVYLWGEALSSDKRDDLWFSGAGKVLGYFTDKPTIYKTAGDSGIIQAWTNFVVTQGVVEGSLAYQLSEDGAAWKYWDGGAWVAAGAFDYNAEATVNTNILIFSVAAQKIYVKSFLISDGTQRVEIDEIQIGYSTNQAPTVDAGTNKACNDNETIAPFSNCSFSDPDGTVDIARYKIDGEVDVWTEIPQGGYGTLLEAVQAFNYQFTNTGVITVQLQVEDNQGKTSDDSLTVTVSKYTVTFNVKDSEGVHLKNISFDPDNGGGVQTKDSPFIWEYEYGTFYPTFFKVGYVGQEVDLNVTGSSQLVNVTLSETLSKSDIPEIAGAVWEEKLIDHDNEGTFGEKVGNLIDVPDPPPVELDVTDEFKSEIRGVIAGSLGGIEIEVEQEEISIEVEQVVIDVIIED